MGARVKGESARDNPQVEEIFVVMGRTGAGKSSFIETVSGQYGQSVGHRLLPHTSRIRQVRATHPGSPSRLVVFVDTPGFDDPYKTDALILTMIAEWLAKTYKEKLKLAGVIYLHRISDNRMPASALDNIRMFFNMCGEVAMPNVVLVTTMWSEVKRDRGLQREQDLRTEFWRPLLEKGARAMRFEDTPQSAWAIADSILGMDPCPPLDIQREMVEGEKPLPQTRAFKYVEEPPQRRDLISKIRGFFSR